MISVMIVLIVFLLISNGYLFYKVLDNEREMEALHLNTLQLMLEVFSTKDKK